MRKSNESLRALKTILDGIDEVPLELYQQVFHFTSLNTFKKNEVIREAYLQEEFAHFIIMGSIALFDGQKIIRPFCKGQIAFDAECYYQKSNSKYSLIALQETKTISIANRLENTILNEFPQFKSLSLILKENSLAEKGLWTKITKLHYKDAIPLLKENFGDTINVLTRKQLSDLLGVNPRTIERYNQKIYQNKKSIVIKSLNNEILNYPFKSKLHPDHESIANLNSDWISKMKLLTNKRDKDKFRKLKLHLLICRLYPDANIEKVNWISKLFILLSMMNDHADNLPAGKKAEFWFASLDYFLKLSFNFNAKNEPKIPEPFKKSMNYLCNNLLFFSSNDTIKPLKSELSAYFKSCIWKASNMDKNLIPSVEQYLLYRPFLSGSKLALQLIPFTLEENQPNIYNSWSRLHDYIDLATKLIFISSDLLTYNKDNILNDPYNGVFLLCHHKGWDEEKAKGHILSIHDQTLEQLLKLDRDYFENHLPENQVLLTPIKKIKYHISGGVAWYVKDTFHH
ncbi:MAG: terpene synthase [Cyclobacteriaceae bacterium]|nr:terpene synthase [Cyclobacteriaceae bacterium]